MKIKDLKPGMLIILAILFSIGIHSCNDEDDDDSVITQQEKDFLLNSFTSNMAEIEFGQLAVQRAVNDSVIVFARTMIIEHTAARNQLDSIADYLEITLPDSMDTSHRTLYRSMSQMTGFAFDSAYMHNQVLDHQTTHDLLQDQINTGDNNLLVSYAMKQLPKVNLYLENAIKILADLNETRVNP